MPLLEITQTRHVNASVRFTDTTARLSISMSPSFAPMDSLAQPPMTLSSRVSVTPSTRIASFRSI